MSRIGKMPVPLPQGVEAKIDGNQVFVKGPKGELTKTFRPEVKLSYDADSKSVLVERLGDDRISRAMHGLTRSLIENMTIGVAKGYEKKLEIFGTGYLAAVQGNVIQIRVGFANEIELPIPEGLTVTCPDQTHVVVSGCDKQLVGQFAANIRAVRKCEPYLGKGIKYAGEVIRRKESKSVVKK